MEKTLRYIVLIVTALYLPTILMGVFSFQGLGSMDMEEIFASGMLIIHSISLILILLACLNIIKKQLLKYVMLFVGLNIVLLILLSILIMQSFIKGDFWLPLLALIPSVLYIIYYKRSHSKEELS